MKTESILVPVDRSACSTAAVTFAGRLAEALGGAITLLHAWEPVYEIGALASASISVGDGNSVPLAQHLSDEAGQTLAEHKRVLGNRKVTVHTRLVEGSPKQAIRDALTSREFGLVIMGTHGRRGLSHMVMGSVAEWVVRTATVPVLTLRAPSTSEP